MTRNEYERLVKDDRVVTTSGNVYRVVQSHWTEFQGETLLNIGFVQIRDGKDYGPYRRLSPANIRIAP